MATTPLPALTSAGPVDLAALVTQKDELVGRLPQAKYANVAADAGQVLGVHAAADTAGEIMLAAAYAIKYDGRLSRRHLGPVPHDG